MANSVGEGHEERGARQVAGEVAASDERKEAVWKTGLVVGDSPVDEASPYQLVVVEP